MFAWFRRKPADAPQGFRHLRRGKRYCVVRAFVDYDQVGHPVGERWTFVRHAFLPYENRLTLVLAAPDGREVPLRLQWRAKAQGPIVDSLDRYLSPVEPALPKHHIATTRDSVCPAEEADAPHAGVVAVDRTADMAALAQTLLAAGVLPHVGADAGRWRLMSPANSGPNRFHHIHTVSWQMLDPALEQQILDIPQRQLKAHVHQHHKSDHLGRRVEIAERAGWFARAGHSCALPSLP
jgi:hypothetical protein